jgi:class III poly(R)-hydroxyalkanoic acid synthase PhaE subunit
MGDPLGNNDWMKDWQALSGQYWKAWQDLARTHGLDSPQTPWHEGLEQWARLFGGAGQGETVERLVASAKNYTNFMQSVVEAATRKGGLDNTASWMESLRGSFDFPGTEASLFANPMARALRDIAGRGARGFEQMMEQLAPLIAPAAADARGWLGLPAFGYLREHQEHLQKSAQALVDYQEQLARYNAQILKASQRGFEIFESKLAEREEPGRQIESLRALYDLWVDAAEEAYAEIALSPEFRDVYGALVNAQMRVRSQLQKEVERVSTDLGMPTRSELNSIGERLQEVRRELRRGHAVDAADLAGEVAALRREIGTLKASIASGPAAAGRAAKKSARKASAATTRTSKRRG